MKKPMDAVIPAGVKRYTASVSTFEPEQNQVTTADDAKIKCALALPLPLLSFRQLTRSIPQVRLPHRRPGPQDQL